MKGPLAYIGGKTRLAAMIISRMPAHKTYVEAFAGGAQVFFHKPPSEVEVLNDYDGEVVNFFRVCQNHYEELVRYLKYVVVSRRWFTLFAQSPPEMLTDIQRAARLLYLQKNSFAGRVVKQNFAYHVIQGPNYNAVKIPGLIEQTHSRLQNVQLECLPYEEVLKKYDREETLFYLDPPYWGRTLYKFEFGEKEFRELEQHLATVKGKFILSINDVPEIREMFSAYKIENVRLAYSSHRKSGTRYDELLISNF